MPDIHTKAHDLTSLLLSGFREDIEKTGNRESAIMYSGGLDSAVVSMLCRMIVGRVNTTLHTFGIEGSRDIANAREGVEFIDIEWHNHILAEEDILKGANGLLELVPDLSFLELSFELPLFLGLGSIPAEIVVTGQGADELFGGYARYREIDDPLARMLMLDKDRVRLFSRTKKLENILAAHFDKKLITPYLHESIVHFSSSLELDDLFDPFGGNKMILRESARILGLPEIVCSRPKLAVQYGSGISKVLKRQRKKGLLNLAEPEEGIGKPDSKRS